MQGSFRAYTNDVPLRYLPHSSKARFTSSKILIVVEARREIYPVIETSTPRKEVSFLPRYDARPRIVPHQK
ncbi:ATP-dependent DNA helicase RRM3 [Echinococcus multilocularis]|uniref:ATP-dependent DNA helicase RRM3 n=1 Tax=Echinococcus multilocularis TaxID=6211 RepID=A0A0S4MKA5_ECHMU|nr:ATP-dependent DNA helicase RRM3 [Echinococcus multilocularis]